MNGNGGEREGRRRERESERRKGAGEAIFRLPIRLHFPPSFSHSRCVSVGSRSLSLRAFPVPCTESIPRRRSRMPRSMRVPFPSANGSLRFSRCQPEAPGGLACKTINIKMIQMRFGEKGKSLLLSLSLTCRPCFAFHSLLCLLYLSTSYRLIILPSQIESSAMSLPAPLSQQHTHTHTHRLFPLFLTIPVAVALFFLPRKSYRDNALWLKRREERKLNDDDLRMPCTERVCGGKMRARLRPRVRDGDARATSDSVRQRLHCASCLCMNGDGEAGIKTQSVFSRGSCPDGLVNHDANEGCNWR